MTDSEMMPEGIEKESFMHIANYDRYKIISFTDRGKELSDELMVKISKGKVTDASCDEGASLDDFVKENFDEAKKFMNNDNIKKYILKHGKKMSGGYCAFSKTMLKGILK